ncbi:MAG TPA: helix-turn-helix domain-containing protein [Nocardioidaceae bacterium]|nr:helix-turn-helix domain-containing protein [Nocardioidaceae bacterium]
MSTTQAGDSPTHEEPAQELPPWAVDAIAAAHLDALCDDIIQRCTRAAFADYQHDTAFTEALRASVHENVHALRDVLCGRLALDRVELRHRLAFADVQAQLRIPQSSLQHSYRISFALQWESWMRLLRAAALGVDAPRDDALQASATLTRVVLAYQNQVVSQVAEKFGRLEDAFNRSRAHIRQRLVRDVLRGEDEALSPADLVTIDYDFDTSHVAVLLPTTPQAAAAPVVSGLQSSLRPRGVLVYPPTMGSTTVWLAVGDTASDEAVDATFAALQASGVPASVSEVQPGLDGLRGTFGQTMQVESFRAAFGPADVIRYSDLRLELLLLQNRELAQTFVTSELGTLSGTTAEAAKMRETLAASFRYGSHVAAAEHLRLHEHTVRNRLQKVEAQLGVAPRDRRTELEVALRLHRLLTAGSPPARG